MQAKTCGMRITALVLAFASSTVSAFSAAPHPPQALAPGVRLGAPAAHRPGGSACTRRQHGRSRLLSMEASATGKHPSARRAPAPAGDQNRRRFLATSVCAALLGVTTSPAEAKEAINDCEKWAPGRRWLTGAYVLLRAERSAWLVARINRTLHLRISGTFQAPCAVCCIHDFTRAHQARVARTRHQETRRGLRKTPNI